MDFGKLSGAHDNRSESRRRDAAVRRHVLSEGHAGSASEDLASRASFAGWTYRGRAFVRRVSGPQRDDHIGQTWSSVAGRAPHSELDLASARAVFMGVNHGPRLGPFCSPRRKREHEGLQFLALLGQAILAMLGMRPAFARFHEAGGDKILEPFRQDVRGDLQGALKFREARETAKYRVSQDEDAPPLPDELQGPRRRAILVFVQPSEHEAS